MDFSRRVALVCNSSWAMVNFRLAVMRDMRARGMEVFVVAPDDGARATLEREGIGFLPWGVAARGTRLGRELGSMRELSAILGRLKPDMALCYTIKPAIYGSLVGALRRIPVYAIITGLGYAFLSTGFHSALARFLYRIALGFSFDTWFLNDDDRALFIDRRIIGKGKGFVLPGEGVDTLRFAPAAPRAEDGKTVFLMVSRLLRDKGVGEYLEAARKVRAERPEAIFRLAGGFGEPGHGAIGPEEIDALAREGVVEYLGRLEDIRPAIADADFVVLPSYREGLPRSLLEAASMGKALVATDVPGSREVAIAGSNALMARAHDVESLVAALLEALDLPGAKVRAMGMWGRDLVESKFGDEAVIAAYTRRIDGVSAPPRGH